MCRIVENESENRERQRELRCCSRKRKTGLALNCTGKESCVYLVDVVVNVPTGRE